MDGTLVDSEKVYLRGYQHAFGKNGITVDSDFAKIFIGMSGADELLEIDKVTGSRAITDKVFKDMLTYAHDEFTAQRVELKVGAKALLAYCQRCGLKIGLATSSHQASATSMLEKLDILSYFDFLVFGDEVEVPKPDPMIYRLAIKRSGFAPKHCLAVEDSFSGVTSAKKADLFVAQIFDDVDLVPAADYNVGTLRELVPIIEQLILKNENDVKVIM